MHPVNYALIHSVHKFSSLNMNHDDSKTQLKIDRNRAGMDQALNL